MTDRDELLNLIKCSIEFCNLAAGEGISIDNLSPEDFLFDYSDATGHEDWCTISDYVIDQIMRDGREIERLTAENQRLREALTPSGETKAAYISEVECDCPTETWRHHVPWTSIKEIMAMIRDRAALTPGNKL